MAKCLSSEESEQIEEYRSSSFTSFQRFVLNYNLCLLVLGSGCALIRSVFVCLCIGYSRKAVSADDIDEGLRLGDYPVLPWRSAQELKPRGWWDEQDRRDKETPVSFCTVLLCLSKLASHNIL